MSSKPKQIKMNFPADLQGGSYANNMLVTHTKEEFVMDFSFVLPPTGTVVSRIMTSPGHMKRIIAALQDNVKKYEAKFGTIVQADELGGAVEFNA
jgi:hypothetical protein